MLDTDQELADTCGLSLEKIRELRQELRDNTPRAQRAKREVGAAFEKLRTGDPEPLRRILCPCPPVSEKTLNETLQQIKLIRRAKEMGG